MAADVWVLGFTFDGVLFETAPAGRLRINMCSVSFRLFKVLVKCQEVSFVVAFLWFLQLFDNFCSCMNEYTCSTTEFVHR